MTYRLSVWVNLCICIVVVGTRFTASAAPHLLLISAARKPVNGKPGARQALEVSNSGFKKIVELSPRVLFGKDTSTVVILDFEEASKQSTLSAIDRVETKIVARARLGQIPVVKRMRSIEQLLAVRSQDYNVYVPVFDPEKSFDWIEANWKTSSVRTNPNPYKGLNNIQALFSIDPGFAIFFADSLERPMRKPTLALFDLKSKSSQFLRLPSDQPENRDQVCALPTIGLLFYHHAGLYLVTDEYLSGLNASERIPISSVESEIYPCLIDGHPTLVWGENKELASTYGLISELVIYDWTTRREVLRKSLGASTFTFMPNHDGTRIYFLDNKKKQIKFLNSKSQTIETFATLENFSMGDENDVVGSDLYRGKIVDAY